MNFHARNLSVTLMAAVSGIALSVCLSPAFAQTYDSPERNRVNADGMPPTHSTPPEKAAPAPPGRSWGKWRGRPRGLSPAASGHRSD